MTTIARDAGDGAVRAPATNRWLRPLLILTSAAAAATAAGSYADWLRVERLAALPAGTDFAAVHAETINAADFPALFMALFFVAGAVLFARWFMAAGRRVRASGAQGLSITPGWSVAGFFLPMLNLVLPFVAMREIWKSSGKPRDWEAQEISWGVNLWWGAWLLANFAAGASSIMNREPTDFGMFRSALLADAVSASFLCASGLLLAWLVERVDRRLASLAGRL